MKKLFQDFKKFCSRGNILELATGVMIGGAFTTIVNSLVNDMLMPVIGLLTGGVNLSGLFFALDFQSYPSAESPGAGCSPPCTPRPTPAGRPRWPPVWAR